MVMKRGKKSGLSSNKSVCDSITPYWNKIIFVTTFSLQIEFLILGYYFFIYFTTHSALYWTGKLRWKEKSKIIQLKNCKKK